MVNVVEAAANRSRTATTPGTSIASYIMNIKGKSIKSVKNLDLTQEGEDHNNQNLRFGSYLTIGRKIFAPLKS